MTIASLVESIDASASALNSSEVRIFHKNFYTESSEIFISSEPGIALSLKAGNISSSGSYQLHHLQFEYKPLV